MADKKIIALMPTYYKKFHCTGPFCEDNCCKEWGLITINKANYMKIKNVRIDDKELADKLKTLYSRVRHDANTPEWIKDSQYAKLELDPVTHKCPILTKEGWCPIHANLGPEYLSKTCQVYPRITTMFNKTAECGLTVSCYEAAALTLFNKNGIDFEYNEITNSEVRLASNSLDLNNKDIQKTFLKHFFGIRNFMIDVLQNRKYSLDDRMVILGIAIKNITELCTNDKLDEIPNAIANLDDLIAQGAFDEGLKAIKPNKEIKASAIRRIASIFHNSEAAFEIVKKMCKIIENGYQINPENLDNVLMFSKKVGNTESEDDIKLEEELNDRYNAGYNELLKPFLADSEYIFENFLVNEVFSKTNTFTTAENVWDVYMRLAAIYAYVKFVFVGVLLDKKSLDNRQIVRTFVGIEKILSYNHALCNVLVKRLHDVGFDELATMTILVKN